MEQPSLHASLPCAEQSLHCSLLSAEQSLQICSAPGWEQCRLCYAHRREPMQILLCTCANPLPTRTLARSKVPERATLSAPCGALSPWPSAIGLHGDTTTLVTEWRWRCASWFFKPPLKTYFPHVAKCAVWVQLQGKVYVKPYFAQVASMS